MPKFLFAIFFSVAASFAAPAPTPESHFKHPIGVDRVLLDWSDVVSYFNKLGAASPMIRVEEIGKSVEGRPMIAATISSADNIKQLSRYREIQHKLADPRTTTAAEAEKLIPQAKNVVLITCSIHATEVASTHTAVEFAYRLITDNSAKYKEIRQNTIVVLMPSINPDGVDIVTRWYRKTLGTQFEGTSPPELYQHYVGHDNNRDWYIFSQPETRNVVNTYNRWLPEILYDVHQQGETASRIFIPPWLDPIEPNVDAIIAQEMNMMGTAMATDLTAAGKTGVAINAAYDFWSPARAYQAYHGGLRILSESASAKLATPVTLKPEQLDTHPLGYNARERSWNHLEPWAGGTWHLRNIIDYQTIAFESLLHNAALHREDMARNFYKVAQRAVSRTQPYAFTIPAEQRDPGAARRLLETLAFGGVEIKKTGAGNHVVLMQQPFSSWAKALLERQNYPDLRMYPGGPPKRPYDTTAETLPLLFGVDVKAVLEPIREKLTEARFPFAAPTPEAFQASNTDTWKTVNRLWRSGKDVWRDEKTGDFSPSEKEGSRKVRQPRVALYRSFYPAMDEGWTRWLLQDFGFEYKNAGNADLQAGDLQKRFDAIIFPDQPANSIANGYRAGTMPEQYSGGVDEKGIAALKTFAQAGGTVICLNHSTAFCIDKLGAQATNVLSGRQAVAGGDEGRSRAAGEGADKPAGSGGQSFYSPGSLLNVKLDTSSPLAKGLPENITIWNEGSPAFTSSQTSVANYPNSGFLASGWLLGGELLADKSALIDAKIGDGHIILFGMRPQYRAQSYQTFKLFFNSLVAYRKN